MAPDRVLSGSGGGVRTGRGSAARSFYEGIAIKTMKAA
jgi:hypothetical protein